MRVSVLLASTIVIASLGLAGCSSSGPATLPVGSQAAPSAFHLAVVGAKINHACPSEFVFCVTVNAASGGAFGICVFGNSSCDSDQSWSWSSSFYRKDGHVFHWFSASFDPNPGNPTVDTIVETRTIKPAKQGAYNWYQSITACNSQSSCISGNVGITTT